MHGKGDNKYDNVRIGMNSRLDTLQAAILKVKFKAFASYELDAVQQIAKRYTNNLHTMVQTPFVPQGFTSSWAQYTIVLDDENHRNNLQNSLKTSAIPSMIYYPKPIHEQAAYGTRVDKPAGCPIAERLCQTVLSLPMHPYLEIDEVDMISAEVAKAISSL